MDTIAFLVTMFGFISLAVLSWRFGADSRPGIDVRQSNWW
jgi:hypothetical protein